MSLSGRKKVSDAKTGHHLFDIVKEHLHFVHSTFAVDSPGHLGSVGGRRLVEVKSNLTCEYNYMYIVAVTVVWLLCCCCLSNFVGGNDGR